MARVRQRSRLHEKGEGVQLQGHIYMVQVRKGERNGLHAQTCESKNKQEETSQLVYIIGPRRYDEVYIYNDVRTWATWDHYPKYARIQEEEEIESFPKETKKWTGWKPKTER